MQRENSRKINAIIVVAYASECECRLSLATWGNAKKGISCKYQFDEPHDLIEL